MDAPQGRVLKLRHDHHEMGFLTARVCAESGANWTLRVESPEEVDEYLDHLHRGQPMALSIVTRDGCCYRGEACVSSVSQDGDVAALVVLAGVGPLLSD